MIFAIAAVSLDLILGYGGMVSFGHAAYLGIGAYAVAIPAFYGIHNGLVQWTLALALSALAALLIGAVSLRTSGVSFIMITLAFAQMLYYLGISINAWGADDGMRLTRRSQFGRSLDLANPYVFYYVVLGLLVRAALARPPADPRALRHGDPRGPLERARACRPSASRPSATSWPPSRWPAPSAAWPERCWPTRPST